MGRYPSICPGYTHCICYPAFSHLLAFQITVLHRLCSSNPYFAQDGPEMTQGEKIHGKVKILELMVLRLIKYMVITNRLCVQL